MDHRRIAMIVVPFLLAACTAAQATTGRGTPVPPTPSPSPSHGVRRVGEVDRRSAPGRAHRPELAPGLSRPDPRSPSGDRELLDVRRAGEAGPADHQRDGGRRCPVGVPSIVRRRVPHPEDRARREVAPASPVRLVQHHERQRVVQLPSGHRSDERLLGTRVRMGDRHQPDAEPLRDGRRPGVAQGVPAVRRPLTAAAGHDPPRTTWSCARSPGSGGDGAATGTRSRTTCTSR